MDYPESRRILMDAIGLALGTTSALNIEYTTTNTQADASLSQKTPLVMAAVNMGGKVLSTAEYNDAIPLPEESVDE